MPLREPKSETNSFPGTLEASSALCEQRQSNQPINPPPREMSISMRLAIPAPAAATVAPPRLRVRPAGNGGSLPAARVALRTETAALR